MYIKKAPVIPPDSGAVAIGDNVFEVDPKTGNIRRRYELTEKEKEEDLPIHPGPGTVPTSSAVDRYQYT